MKIATIIGARPQFIKAATISRCIQNDYADKIEEIIIHTGQHYDANMSEVFFSELDIPRPHHHLGIGGGSHGANTGRMIEAIESILSKESFDWVLVYGDTDSTLAASIAASKLGVRIAHVEAGLRSYNRAMPEEINRVLTDHVSDLLFTPTEQATKNLIKEGINPQKIKQVGDVMHDAALFYQDKAQAIPGFTMPDSFIVFTLHRAENTNDPHRLRNIMHAMNSVAKNIPVVMPLHPRTKQAIEANEIETDQLTLIDPASYLQMIGLLKQCKLVVTDSGGLQKEAFFFKKPCVTTRDETEWVELVNIGVNQLAGTTSSEIISAVNKMRSRHISPQMLYGNATAANQIVASL